MADGVMSRVKTALLMPYSLFQVVTGRKDFRDPVLGSERLNRKGLHVWRVKTTARIMEWRRRKLTHLISDAERVVLT